jgi:hypothetical protein
VACQAVSNAEIPDLAKRSGPEAIFALGASTPSVFELCRVDFDGPPL